MIANRWRCPECGSPDVQVSLPTWWIELADGTLDMVEADDEAEVTAWFCEACDKSGSGKPVDAGGVR